MRNYKNDEERNAKQPKQKAQTKNNEISIAAKKQVKKQRNATQPQNTKQKGNPTQPRKQRNTNQKSWKRFSLLY